MKINISPAFKSKNEAIRLGILAMDVHVQTDYPTLLDLITQETQQIAATMRIEEISQLPAISAARKGYKAVGKDPARYRLSAEALLRRTIQGKGLYQVNNIVDALNLVSLKSGISIGGYDMEKIEGDIELGIGAKDEPYEGIGRGKLNIEYMPVLRDEQGAFGSPTSDSQRTMVTNTTQQFLLVFFSFAGQNGLSEAMDHASDLLTNYANGNILRKEILE